KVLEKLNVRIDLLSDRLSNEGIEGGTAVRFKIWEAGISSLEGGQLLYGHGMSSFRMLALKNNIDFYAHSVFIDIITTTGFLVLFILVILYLSLIYKSFVLNNSIVLAIILFSILNYFTHGNITSLGF